MIFIVQTSYMGRSSAGGSVDWWQCWQVQQASWCWGSNWAPGETLLLRPEITLEISGPPPLPAALACHLWERLMVIIIRNMWRGEKALFFKYFKDFTIIHVTPRWGRQVLVTLQWIKGLVHFHKFLSFPLSFLVLKQAPGQFIWLPSSYPATLASYRQKTKIRAFTNKIIKKNC